MWVLDVLGLIADLFSIGEVRDKGRSKKKEGRKLRGGWFRRRG